MANVLDDLFQWAAQQPADNITSIRLAMTGNELTRNNLVSYAEGTLFYHPAPSRGFLLFPANFSSETNGITQYFSDRRFAPDGDFLTAPFDPHNTDPLDITIFAPRFSPQYAGTVHSSKWDFEFTVNLSSDPATGIIYATTGPTFLTISLCNRISEPPPQ